MASGSGIVASGSVGVSPSGAGAGAASVGVATASGPLASAGGSAGASFNAAGRCTGAGVLPSPSLGAAAAVADVKKSTRPAVDEPRSQREPPMLLRLPPATGLGERALSPASAARRPDRANAREKSLYGWA